jgi:phosphohistidine phosphatase SixA
MNLILWRHAEAVDLGVLATPGSKRDLERPLTDKGQQQAKKTPGDQQSCDPSASNCARLFRETRDY